MNVITPFKKKDSDQDNDDRKPYSSSKLRRYRLRVATGVGLAIFVALIVAIVLYVTYQNKVYTGYTVKKKVAYQRVEGSSVLSYDNKFLTYSKDGIHCTNGKGKDLWSVPYEMQSPKVVMQGEFVAVADTNGRKVYVFDFDGERCIIDTVLPVKNMAISGDGVVVVVTEEDDITFINLYSSKAEKIATFRTTMDKSGYPIAIGISKNSKLVGVSYLYVDNGELTTKIAFYNFGGVGQNEIDNLVSGYDYNEKVAPVIRFLNNKTAYALTGDELMFYSGKERPTNSENVKFEEEVEAVYDGDGKVGLLFGDSTGKAKYRLDVYSSKGKKLTSIPFNMEYSDIFFANDLIVIYNANSASIYRTNGKIKYEGDFSDSVSLMIPTSSPIRYTLVTQDAIKTIELK